MKKNKLVKLLTILIIISICFISFAGIWIKKQGQMKNVLPDYILGMNISGTRTAKFNVSDETEEIIYDAEGNVTTEGTNEDGSLKEGYTKEDKKVNSEEVLTQNNYETVKKVMEKRLENIGVSEYVIRLNNQNGEIILELPENSNTDEIISNLTYLGKFEIKDSQTDEVLINNNDVKQASAVYGSTNSGTAVYLSIEFNKEGKEKLENITKTYISSTDEDGNKTTKNISIELDEETMLETYFSETISNGILQLTIGSASTSNEEIASYIKQANQVAGLIDGGVMPIHYELEQNNYMSAPAFEMIEKVVLGIIFAVVLIGFIYWIIRYKANGIFATISYIGWLAITLLVIRYANVSISLETILAIITLLICNYLILQYTLKQFTKKGESKNGIINKTYKRYASIFAPIAILSVVFTFINWLSISSIGMVLFWGMTILTVYDYIVMKILFEIKEVKK
ncbi:MAG: hypothetical protein J6A04_06675 [Clostridia bacterium]|nr:hypothetical protein [Clostridia bacterium]